MARSTFQSQINPSIPNVEERIANVLKANGFSPYKYRTGENVWKKGVGFLTASKYIKVEYLNDTLILSAWIRNFGISEGDLSGFVGAIPKSTVKTTVVLIQKSVGY